MPGEGSLCVYVMPVIVQSWKCNLSLQTTTNIFWQIPVKTRDDILNLISLLLEVSTVEYITLIPNPNITIINSLIINYDFFVAVVKRERDREREEERDRT